MPKTNSVVETSDLIVEIVEWLNLIPEDHRKAVAEMMKIDIAQWKKEEASWPTHDFQS